MVKTHNIYCSVLSTVSLEIGWIKSGILENTAKRNLRNLILKSLSNPRLMLRFLPILAGKGNWMCGFHRPSKMRFLRFCFLYTERGGSSFARFWRQEFGEFPRPAGVVGSYSSGPPAGPTPQILVDKTLRMTSSPALYTNLLNCKLTLKENIGL